MNYKEILDLIMSDAGKATDIGLEFYMPRFPDVTGVVKQHEDYFTIDWQTVVMFLKGEVNTLNQKLTTHWTKPEGVIEYTWIGPKTK